MTTTTTGTATELDGRCIATIRTLCIDAIQSANSGHPGTPIGIAPVTYTLWQRFLRFDPADPIWPNRDRFVLSSGHASALLWSLLHLTGSRRSIPTTRCSGSGRGVARRPQALPAARLEGPGHPEYRWTSGVEATTGPLGTGAATSVGMAVASQWLRPATTATASRSSTSTSTRKPGDGDMMEGIASEAASFAAHQRLSNLCWIYDSNRITIEGHTDITFTEDVAARFLAYGWNVTTRRRRQRPRSRCERALHDFKAEHERPTLIVVHSHIGYGSPVEDTPKAHGEPLGPEGVKATKRFLGWPEDARVPRAGRRLRALRGWYRCSRPRGSRGVGGARSRHTGRPIPSLPTRSSGCNAAIFRTSWDGDIPTFPRRSRKGSRAGTPRDRS